MNDYTPKPTEPITLDGTEAWERSTPSVAYYNVATGGVMRVPIRTNYDRLISKSPEELARWIWAVQTGIKCEDIVSTDGWLDWLKQEAGE